MTVDGQAAAVGVGTVRERDWLFDRHAQIGEALDDCRIAHDLDPQTGQYFSFDLGDHRGCFPLGTRLSTYGYAVAEADAIDLVQQVLKSPIRAFDSSNAYSEGESERRIGIGIASECDS